MADSSYNCPVSYHSICETRRKNFCDVFETHLAKIPKRILLIQITRTKPNTAARAELKYIVSRRPNLSENQPRSTTPRSHPAKMTEDETLARIDVTQMRSHWKSKIKKYNKTLKTEGLQDMLKDLNTF